MNKKASLSIVIPCFNEEEVVLSSYVELKKMSEKWKNVGLIADYELLFVNNGSTDKTIDILRDIFNKDKKVIVIDLRKNFGFQGSISCGLFSASNEMIVNIDADLQDDPSKIEEMINKYYEGYEMVLGIRNDRKSDTFLKRAVAQAFYKLLDLIGIKSVYNHADFRLLSKEIVEKLKEFPEKVRYLRCLIFEVESKYTCVFYGRRERKSGRSKFSFFSLISFALDGITSFSGIPIRLISLAGLIMFLISIIGGIMVLLAKYVWFTSVSGWAFLAIAVLFFGGIQNLFLGIIGEYVSKIFLETKQRPIYIIRKEYKHNSQ